MQPRLPGTDPLESAAAASCKQAAAAAGLAAPARTRRSLRAAEQNGGGLLAPEAGPPRAEGPEPDRDLPDGRVFARRHV